MISDKDYIIDPLTTLCKIALLFFMPEKTKIAINYHVLYIQEYSYYQWFERMKNRDSRKDISTLNTPFLKAIKWYILDNTEKIDMDNELSNCIRIITQFAINGLIKLQIHTYSKDDTTRIILQYFINMLTSALDSTWDEKSYIGPNINIGFLTDKIKHNYDPSIIISIAKMLSDINIPEKSKQNTKTLIECVHQLLINRDYEFVKLMRDINTTF